MRSPVRFTLVLLGAFGALSAADARAADRCSAAGMMQDKSFRVENCAAAFYADQNSVTLWFTEKPLPPAALDTFHLGSYADLKGTALSISFCLGEGSPAVAPKSVRTVETGVNHAASPMVQQTWVFHLPKDAGFRVEKLSGEIRPGGRLTGRMSLKAKLDQGQAYSWEADFDVVLPDRAAAAGLSCSD